MNKIIFVALIAGSIGLIQSAFAETPTVTTVVAPAPVVTWTSKNTTDEVTINNGNGNTLTITINVDKVANPASPPAGVNVKNCGSTTHIDPGSSGICTSSDASNPVSFSSDSPTYKASGTYQIK